MRDASVAFGAFWLLTGLGGLLDLTDVRTTSTSEGIRVVISVACLVTGIWLWRRHGYTPQVFQSRGLLGCIVIAAVISVANLFFD
jgi:hypothetical protein